MIVLLRLKNILTWIMKSTTILALITTSAVANENLRFGLDYKHSLKHKEEKLSKQLTCLARNVYYEARGEPIIGQKAVAQVTVNRVRSSEWPNDLCSVVSQTTMTQEGKVCQFSWYCDEKFNKKLVIDKNNPSYIAAKQVLLEGHKVLDDHTYFFRRYDVYMHPSWPNKTVIRIGNHVFYKK